MVPVFCCRFIIFVRAKKEENGQRLFRTQIDGYTGVENNDKKKL